MGMVHYLIPVIGFLVHKIGREKNLGWKKDASHQTLSKLLLGASLFGVIDHAWNSELFLIHPNWQNDLLLGLASIIGIFVVWGILQFNSYRQESSAKNTI